ncbi:MAG: NUDIX hydrolase [Pseudomonadota bacterium]|nr:MAG: NUDIX hydrolase [Pseudomonadota bacterium]
MIWTPHVTVAAIIAHEERFLLVEEDDNGRRVLNQPAGHLEPDESLLDAVVRETLEETGWRFAPHAIIGIYRWTNPVDDVTYVRFCFAGEHSDFDPDHELDPDIVRTVWKSRAEIAAAHSALRSPLVLRSIDDYLAGRRYSTDLLGDAL